MGVRRRQRRGAPGSPWHISKKGGPTYDDTLFRLDDAPASLLRMLPNDVAAALHQDLVGNDRLTMQWEAVADGALLALLHRGTADGCQWDAFVPHLCGRHPYMTTSQGNPCPV